MSLLWTLHLASTWMMTGIIWFVQVVHYPLFGRVGQAEFVAYEAQHTWRTGLVVAPLMLMELGSGLLLLWREGGSWLWVNIALLAGIWLSTALIQVPLHGQLHQGWEASRVRRLVGSNWIRTVAWTLRALLLAGWVWEEGLI
ncbi:MAG: hypothetical protein D6722_18645 [Bacteroidetes bacterium]|nr:MAG: hypothetical protein D6722_18645 [Bacteroidota bacterium]